MSSQAWEASPAEPAAPHPLTAVFRPSALAVIGASSDTKKRGYAVLRALAESGFEGGVYPVNPKGGTIADRTVYPSLDETPTAPDLALICLPAERVPDAIAACGRRGVRAAVVLAVGFGESGDEGRVLSDRVVAEARASGVRIVGPNTSGILDLPTGLNLIGARGVRSGGLSLVVQSGNVALAFMNEVTARTEEGIAVCVGVGNAVDLGFADYVDYLATDDSTRAIVVYAEGMRDARAFLEVAGRVGRSKPILVLKGARTESGQRAALSHTGALAGDYDRFRAGLKQAGVVEVTRSDELVHLAETLAGQPAIGAGAGLAILSDGGGQGTLASDAFADRGIALARLSDATREALRVLLGRAAAVTNPVDLAGAADADPLVFDRALEVLSADRNVGGVLLVGLFGGYAIRFSESMAGDELACAERMAARMADAGKAFVVHSMYAPSRSEPLRTLGRAGVPVIESLDIAVRCAAALVERGALLESPAWPAPADPEHGEAEGASGAGSAEPTPPASTAGVQVIEAALSEERTTLTEPEATALLRDFGMPFPAAVNCRTRDEVRHAAETLGGTLVLKAVSPHIPHKTDAGGVELDVVGPEEAVGAFNAIRARTRAYLRDRGIDGEIDGAVVAPMLEPPLAELIVGACRDPGLGPVLTVGAGGIWVELLRDAAHRVLPVTDEDIRGMLGDLGVHALLTGARGRPAADLDAVVAAVQAVSRCVTVHERVSEIEVNPLFVYADRVAAVDARVFLTT